MTWTEARWRTQRRVALIAVHEREFVEERAGRMNDALDELALRVAYLPASPLTAAQCKRLQVIAKELRRRATATTSPARARKPTPAASSTRSGGEA